MAMDETTPAGQEVNLLGAHHARTAQPASPATTRVLMILPPDGDSQPDASRIYVVLRENGFEVATLGSTEVLAGAVANTPDVVFINGTDPGAAALCAHLNQPEPPGAGGLDGQAPVVALIESGGSLAEGVTASDVLSSTAGEAEIVLRCTAAGQQARLRRELATTRERLAHQVQVDDLTKVFNRRYFFQAAYRECSRARRYNQQISCLMVDVNHFQLFNTTFGYNCGDYVLRDTAKLLRACVRDTDCVARFGGSKFVILLTHTDTDGAAIVREKIDKLVSGNYYVWHHQQLPISVSIGEASCVPGNTRQFTDGETGDEVESVPLSIREELAELLEDADSALFIAKKGVRFPTFLDSSEPLA